MTRTPASSRRFVHPVHVAVLLALAPLAMPPCLGAQEEAESDTAEARGLTSTTLSGLRWREIGPAATSGRVADIVVDPTDRSIWYVAAASGGVWKTENAGTTWEPIFDGEGSYSIGALALDPHNHLVLWVGTGENNGQRSVGYGDGVYKSVDGGGSFENVGLDSTEHVGMIRVDPRDSDIVYVAAQGPLWAAGGQRGLYKTADGGETWERVLEIDEHTGVNEVHFDPRNPDVLYASAWQRRRHQWTMIDGGSGSGIHKSTDGGETWKEIDEGLPSGDKGRIGLAVSPVDPDVLYAIVEASGDDGGTFRSDDMGESWERTSRYQSSAPMYYHEIFADPHRFDWIYSLDTRLEISRDGGENWERMPGEDIHVDYHALVFDPGDPDHLIAGNDGGVYETFDFGESWDFVENLPITQFYKVALSTDEPFYDVYGGTQDNNTLGGPSRTMTDEGIRNGDWFVTMGGDGFDPAVDPENPDIIYSQLQYGVLVRYDRASGERIDIQPQPEPDGPPLRWNWDAGLHISPHDNERIYFAAQILFQSDDRGESWRAISGDLTRDLDRNRLPVMGRVWSVDAVGKNRSTSPFGSIVVISESPLVEGLLYVGTDDGLLQVSEDGGGSWRRIESFPAVPDTSYVADVEASLHDPNAVFAVLQNFKRGDFRPYVLKSSDRGRTWTSIAGDLPERGSAYTIAQDHEEPNLLFVGTEFGVYTSVDGGASWLELSSGMPTIATRELEIQRRENDLVAATFGRGFRVLDDYTPLRELTRNREQIMASDGHLFPVETGLMFVETSGQPGSQGASFYAADNPPFGATFSYYVGETLRTLEAERQREERRRAERGEDTPYPPWDSLKAEDREEEPAVWLTIRDVDGNVVNHVEGSTSRGVHRATWNFRYPGYRPITGGGGGGFGGDDDDDDSPSGLGPAVVPGEYTVALYRRTRDETAELVAPVRFTVEPIGQHAIPPQDRAQVLAFQRQTGALQRAVMGTAEAAEAAAERLELIKRAVEETPAADRALRDEARRLELRLTDLREALNGDPTRARRAEPAMPGIIDRVNQVVFGHWRVTHGPTATHRRQYEIAAEQFTEVHDDLRQLIETDLPALEERLEAAGAPWTPGRGVPSWTPPSP
ncbi:MAG: WD40/YVTN/BNR-like repeat-containing protein [Gemmatimonadota bacterium]